MDSGKMSFETEFLLSQLTGIINMIKSKCIGYIGAIRLKGCRTVVTIYMTETLHAYSHFISLTDLKKNHIFSFCT